MSTQWMCSGISLWLYFALYWILNYVKHLFMCLLAIWNSAFAKCLFKPFPCITTELSFFLLTWRSTLCILDASSVSYMQYTHLLPFRNLPFHFLNSVFWWTELWMWSSSVIFLLWGVLFLPGLRSLFLPWDYDSILCRVIFNSFIVLLT